MGCEILELGESLGEAIGEELGEVVRRDHGPRLARECPGGDDDAPEPVRLGPLWFCYSDDLRRLLAHRGALTMGDIVEGTKHRGVEVGRLLAALEEAGLVRCRHGRGPARPGVWSLTAVGLGSLQWAGPPLDVCDHTLVSYAAEMAIAVSDVYGVAIHEVYHAEVGIGVTARARLCAAMVDTGWSFEGVAQHLGIPLAWVVSGAGRWMRMAPPAKGFMSGALPC